MAKNKVPSVKSAFLVKKPFAAVLRSLYRIKKLTIKQPF